MRRLTGLKIDKLDFVPTKQGDLLYHEGPLLSVFKDNLSNNFYFYKWSGSDEKAHRWLVFKVSVKNLNAFFEKEMSLQALILEQPFTYFLDLNNDIDPIRIVIVSTQNIPPNYLPDANSFFDAADFENYALVLKQEIKKSSFQVA